MENSIYIAFPRKILVFITLLMVIVLLSGCNTTQTIEIGQYKCGESIIEIKKDDYVCFSNIDFSSVQQFYDENDIKIKISERVLGDIKYELGTDPTRIYVLTDEEYTLNMRYDYDNKTITLMGQTYHK